MATGGGRIAADAYPDGPALISADLDESELSIETDARLIRFQADIRPAPACSTI